MIYFDNGATTFPKPSAVIDEVRRCMTYMGGNAGRGGHALSRMAAEKVFECREALARMFGAEGPDRVFFVPNTTHGINTVIKGCTSHGGHVIISDMEHNAVFRPIYKLASEGRISYSIFRSMVGDSRQNPLRVCANVAKLIRPDTKLVFCTHASNICSATLPISQIGAFCRRHGILFGVDAAQSAGREKIDIAKMNIDFLCVPGHKGLYGPQGSAAVILGKGVELDTLIEGGNGTNSLSGEMSEISPERYEAGTLPAPAIAGLCKGIQFVRTLGEEQIAQRERAVCKRACELLGNNKKIKLYLPECIGSTVLFEVDGHSSEHVASALDSHGICVRGGFHCASLAHQTLGTSDGGAVRLSFGAFNVPAQADMFYKTLLSQI